jgi:hypothetical protein
MQIVDRIRVGALVTALAMTLLLGIPAHAATPHSYPKICGTPGGPGCPPIPPIVSDWKYTVNVGYGTYPPDATFIAWMTSLPGISSTSRPLVDGVPLNIRGPRMRGPVEPRKAIRSMWQTAINSNPKPTIATRARIRSNLSAATTAWPAT